MVNKFYRMFGGTERYVFELTREWELLGHEIIPFAMSDPRNRPTAYEKYFVSHMELLDRARRPASWKVSERVIYSREARRKMSELVSAERPDIAHINNIYHYISPSILDALAKQGVPTIMTLHDYKIVCPTYSLWVDGAICERCLSGRFYHCTLRRCNHGTFSGSLLNTTEAYAHRLLGIYDKVAIFISPSLFLREKHIVAGMDPDKILHVPNFLVVDDYAPCYEHSGYFAYVGRLEPYKGVDVLLDAVHHLRSSVPLLIVGDGSSRRGLEQQAASLGLENVRFLGYQTGDRLRELIAQAMFAVVPSAWYENCPYSVLEAFALGTPVVASAIGGIPELVVHGDNGLLVRPSAPEDLAVAIAQMLSSPSRFSNMGRAARRCVENHYDQYHHVEKLERAYVQAGLSPKALDLR